MSLISYFPEKFSPTNHQIQVIKKLEEALQTHDKVILCAPTGTGKSFISNTISNYSSEIAEDKYDSIYSYNCFNVDHHGQYVNDTQLKPHGAFTLTITKALQDQYVKLFDCESLKGKSNYMSTLEPTMDVEIESAVMPTNLLNKHRREHRCDYYNDRRDLLIGKLGVTNYKMFLSLPDHVKYKDYIICDEASELEDELVSICTCHIDYELLKRVGLNIKKLTTDEPLAVYTWLDDLAQDLQEQRTYLQRKLQKKTAWSPREQSRYRTINQLHSKLVTCINNFYDCEFVIERKLTYVTMTPLYINTLADKVFRFAKKSILMSATIIDHKKFAESLGITNYKYIEIDSNFPVENSPIYITSKYPLSHNTMSKNLPKIIDLVDDIMSNHKNEKGIIHTHTHSITQQIYDSIQTNQARLLYREPGTSNEEILTRHRESDEPTVIMSPSLSYGIDLKDELSRFQIVIKLPYLPLGDKRIKQLFDKDKDWYENKMLNSLVQACGRSTRNVNDHCKTYILDGLSTKVIIKCKHKLPKHFLQRFI